MEDKLEWGRTSAQRKRLERLKRAFEVFGMGGCLGLETTGSLQTKVCLCDDT
jgi:hypothetical protein